MNENNLKSIIEQVIRELNVADKPSVANETASPLNETTCEVPEITAYEMENYFAVPSAENKDAYMNYKKNTPARVGIWRAGPRYTTQTMLRFRADHAVAQDAVFTDVSDEIIEKYGWLKLQTEVNDKDEYLTRPDLGRIINAKSIELLKANAKASPKVQIYISDGLSSTAIETNAYDTYKAMEQGLKSHGIEVGTPFFVKYGRVPAMDHISEILNAEVTVVLIGERPGLATGESMSCYMIYKGKVGNPESLRTVVSNIHKNGTPAVEAGAHIADIIKRILAEQKSGVELKL